jgi:hypothetical protein
MVMTKETFLDAKEAEFPNEMVIELATCTVDCGHAGLMEYDQRCDKCQQMAFRTIKCTYLRCDEGPEDSDGIRRNPEYGLDALIFWMDRIHLNSKPAHPRPAEGDR